MLNGQRIGDEQKAHLNLSVLTVWIASTAVIYSPTVMSPSTAGPQSAVYPW